MPSSYERMPRTHDAPSGKPDPYHGATAGWRTAGSEPYPVHYGGSRDKSRRGEKSAER